MQTDNSIAIAGELAKARVEWQRTHIPEQIRSGAFTVLDDGWLSYFDENGFRRFWDGPVEA